MKILVIGAGISGITAGHILAEKNIEFEILEASAVHGGRIKKIDGFADFPIDLGAEWIHKWIKAKPPLMESLLAGTNPDFESFKYRPKTYSLWRDGKLRKYNFMSLLPTFNDDKFVNSTWFDFLDGLVTPELKERIHYNTPVNKIEYSDTNDTDKVIVSTTSGEEFIADKVLITVPIKMLQKDYIKFEPALPEEKIKAINKEQMSDGLKVFIEFSERFYPDILLMDSVLYNLRGGDYLYYDSTVGKDTSKNVLGLFVDGEKATQYTSLENDAVIEYVLDELDRIFDGQATQFYIKHVVQNWSKEPFIQGTYSHRKSSVKTLSAPIASKIYFAGEAMNPNGKTIAVHGASESAYLMLDKMLEDL